MKYLYRQRPFSYDQDWLHAFKKAGVECVHESPEMELDDLTFLGHSILGNDVFLMDYTIKKLQKRKGGLVVFLGNEWKWFEEKRSLVKALGADLNLTQLPIDTARKLYGDIPLLEIPHGLGDYFRSVTPRKYRNFDIGVRGMKYSEDKVGDNDRGTVCSEGLWAGLRCDFQYGFMLKRTDWRRALSDWLAMPSTEAGLVGAKAISSRHFDAIGCATNLVMYEGHFNGILRPHEHYIVLNRDHSNLEEVIERLNRDGKRIAEDAFQYVLNGHTVDHRIKCILDHL